MVPVMHITQYMANHDLTPAQMAAKLECSQQLVYLLMKDNAWPSRKMMAKIHDVTGGEVEPKDVFIL